MDPNSSAEKHKDPCLMKTHFLRPYVTSIDGPVAELPRNSPSVSSSDLKASFSRISFAGFMSMNSEFRSWARKMEALHEPTWRKAGIFEAIKASTYKILEDESLIIALVEKWCPETKSFVFPWGEATITLEDVMVLLGFSVLGSPVFAPLESSEMRDSVDKLSKVRAEIRENMNKYKLVSSVKWVLSFRDRDDSLEHEAFLAMWLSHLVFPHNSRRSISKHVFPLAVRLARGERIAFAPAVLASLHRDLGQIQAFAREKSTQYLCLKSLFKLVQVWAWERFKNIRPQAREIRKGEPRIAQWECLKQRDEKECLSFDDFDWRPYSKPLENWNPPGFYLKKAKWVTVDDSLGDDFASFARCVRSSQLVGIGFVEGYYPNRVAMQFGFSQDLPGLVTHHSNFTEQEAWDDYNKSLDDLKLYVPSRLAKTSVTARYRDWWLKSVSEFLGSSDSTKTFTTRNTADHYDNDDVSPKVLPLRQVLQKSGLRFPTKLKRCRKRRIAKHIGYGIKKYKTGDCGASASTEVPLSELFQKELAKRTSEHLRNKRRKRARDDDDEKCMDCHDDITIAQLIKSRKKTGGDESESRGKRRHEEDNNDLRIFQKFASGDDETVAPQEIEPRSEENVEEETRSDAEVTADPSLGSNGGVVDIVVSPPEARQNCGCDDGVYVSRINAEKKTMVDDGTKEVQCLVNGDGEVQRPNDDDDERLKQIELDESETLAKRSSFEEDNNDSGICQKLASGNDESVALQEIERRNEENDEEETGSQAEKLMVLSLSRVLQKLGQGFPEKFKRSRYLRTTTNVRSEIKTGKIVNCGGSASREVTIGEVFQKDSMKRKSEHLGDKLDESKTLETRSSFEEDNNDSGIFQKLSSGNDESVARQEIEQRNEENDEEETGSEAEKIMVLIPSYGNNPSVHPPCSNGGVVDIVVSPPKARKICGCDDELDVNGIHAEKKTTVVGDGTKEAVSLLHEDTEMQKSNKKEDDDDADQRLKQKELAINELALNLEARMKKVEITLAKIRDWKTRRNQMKNGVSALANRV